MLKRLWLILGPVFCALLMVAAGEMEEIKLTKEQLSQYPDLKKITIKVEKE